MLFFLQVQSNFAFDFTLIYYPTRLMNYSIEFILIWRMIPPIMMLLVNLMLLSQYLSLDILKVNTSINGTNQFI